MKYITGTCKICQRKFKAIVIKTAPPRRNVCGFCAIANEHALTNEKYTISFADSFPSGSFAPTRKEVK